MSVTTTEVISTPGSKTEWISIKSPRLQKNIISSSEIYFVIVHTINGGRFYSEAVQGSEAAYELFSSYCDIAEYFGGICELFYVNEDGYDIIDHQIF